MGQNTYAEWFINMMLGWIRWIANGIASMFQFNSPSGGSSGSAFIRWFSANWITLLIVLVVLGIVTDWVIWMIRWRPYWLWFRKKRVLLDDDIDAILSDEELLKKFAPPKKRQPRFRASPLGRGGRPIPRDELTESLYAPEELDLDYDEYDEQFDAPDIEDPYADSETGYDDYEPYDEDDDEYSDIDEEPEDDEDDIHIEEDEDADYEKEQPFDQLYNDVYSARPDDGYDDEEAEAPDDEPDISFIEGIGDEDDIPRKKRVKKAKGPGLLTRLKRKKPAEDEDPFSVDDADFYDPDDDADFFSAISAEPEYLKYDPDELTDPGARPVAAQTSDEFDALYPDHDAKASWRTGYSTKSAPVEPEQAPRRAKKRKSGGRK